MNRSHFASRAALVSRRAAAGVTLVESAVVASVVAVTAGLVAPSFESASQRRQLEGAATQLETDLHFARMLAVARNTPLRISFESGVGGSCYVIHTGAANQCRCAPNGDAVCQGDAQAERSVRFSGDAAVALRSNTRSVLFDPVKGTSSPTATVQFNARNGTAIHQVLNIMGRVRSCSPAPAIPGYKRC